MSPNPAQTAFEALHPLVVHFPIALLLFAWVLLVGGAIDGRRRWGWLLAGLVTLVVGTMGSFLAIRTGEAAAAIAPETQAIRDAIHNHEELGETARTVFVIVTLLVGGTMLATRLKPGKRAAVVTIGVILSALGYMGGAAILAEASHAGGLLVHEMGIHAPLGARDPEKPADAEKIIPESTDERAP